MWQFGGVKFADNQSMQLIFQNAFCQMKVQKLVTRKTSVLTGRIHQGTPTYRIYIYVMINWDEDDIQNYVYLNGLLSNITDNGLYITPNYYPGQTNPAYEVYLDSDVEYKKLAAQPVGQMIQLKFIVRDAAESIPSNLGSEL